MTDLEVVDVLNERAHRGRTGWQHHMGAIEGQNWYVSFNPDGSLSYTGLVPDWISEFEGHCVAETYERPAPALTADQIRFLWSVLNAPKVDPSILAGNDGSKNIT
jgi:hypothetical protein